MTASESSVVGLSVQSAKGTPQSTDANFDYFMFSEGGIGPQNMIIPLDQEVGGGAMLRSMIKAGVASAGAFNLIPRPLTVGLFLSGAIGLPAAPAMQGATTAYKHTFVMGTDQFDAPYFTVRSGPGNLWGEQFQDVRVAAFGLNWRAPDYVRGTIALTGGLPTPNIDMAAWAPSTYIDAGPQFITPVSVIELPDASAVKCLGGSFAAGMQIPMDEQWIVGSYSPDDFEINSRMFVLTLNLKITNKTLYNKMSYDPADGIAWTASILKEGLFDVTFNSDQLAGTAIPYSLKISGNGQNQASGNGNVAWSCTPISLRAGRQVVIQATGTFLASPTAAEPITVELINKKSTQYGVYS